MDDAAILASGFERWSSRLPLQTAVYIHRYAARDGARLILAVPRTPTDAPPAQPLHETVARFFARHGGRQPEPAVAYLQALI